jgi:hypothetical protein
MGWPGADISGTIFTDAFKGRDWLHAICLGVNERQGLLGITKTAWTKADGVTTVTDPVLADFEDMFTSGRSTMVELNLRAANSAIQAMIGSSFTRKTSGLSYFTEDSLKSDALNFSSAASFLGVRDPVPWQTIKSNLDAMLYLGITPRFTSTGTRTGSDSNFNAQTSWANRAIGSSFETDGTPFTPAYEEVYWQMKQTGTNWVAEIMNTLNVTAATAALRGVITDGYYNYTGSAATIDGDDFTVTAGSESFTATEARQSTDDFSSGADTTFTLGITTAQPTTNPLPTTPGTHRLFGRVSIEIYTDLSTLLTDQA